MTLHGRTNSVTRARIATAIALWLALSVGSELARRSTALTGFMGTFWTAPFGAAALPEFGGPESTARDILDRLRLEQQQSIERSLAVLDSRFDEYRDRSGAFAKDLLRWSTRGRLAWRSMKDVAGGDSNARRELVRERFEAIVVSEAQLRTNIFETVERLALELRADRARALARVRAAVAVDPLAAGDSDRLSSELARLDEQMDRMLLRQADRSLIMAVATLVGATVVTEIVAMAIGSAMTGAAVGAAGGSIIPGAGTVVGFATGLAAGVAVDWWLSSELEQDLTRRSAVAIDALRRRVIDGDAEIDQPHDARDARDARGTVRGLRAMLESMAEREAEALEAPMMKWDRRHERERRERGARAARRTEQQP